jgi:hypothetical protein
VTSVRRVLVLLLSLWFTVYIGEPEWVSPCPTHDGVAAAQMAGAAHEGHGGHGAVHGASSDRQGAAHTPGGAHQCHCPGPCCGASAATIAERVGLPLGEQLASRLARIAPTADVVPAGAPHVLPFANGPPARALGASRVPSVFSTSAIA